MARLVSLVLVAACILFSLGELSGQDTKLKGTLPANWGKLGLSDEQKQKIYKVQADYVDQINKLDAQIKDLKAKEKTEMEKALTDAQKARLKELLLEKLPKDDKK